MAYSAWCDTDPPTKWWITGTGSTIDKLSEVIDDNPSGVEIDDNPGNYLAWSNFMNEHVENRLYEIILNMYIGDGSTPTNLTSINETVYFNNCELYVVANAILTLGRETNSWPDIGSLWSILNTSSYHYINNGGTINLYASNLILSGSNKRVAFINGTFVARQSNIYISRSLEFSNSDITLEDVLIAGNGVNSFLYISGKTSDISNLRSHNHQYSIESVGDIDIENLTSSSSITADIYLASNSGQRRTSLINSDFSSVLIAGTQAAYHCILDIHTVNINVSDKNGNPLQNTSIEIKDINNNIVSYYDSTANLSSNINTTQTTLDVTDGSLFSSGDIIKINDEYILVGSISGNSLIGCTRAYYGSKYPVAKASNSGSDIYIVGNIQTDINGDITQINISRRGWFTSAKTLNTYSTHTFTISKSEYETLVLENITIDEAIDWHLELQNKKAPYPVIGGGHIIGYNNE